MTYLTLEVDIDHGKVSAKEPGKLPETGHGLLTILQPAIPEPSNLTRLQAFEELQKSLNLDEAKAKAWIDTIRDARR
jgi:hypothetical protein